MAARTKAPASWREIQHLALSINGYAVAGDDACGAMANALDGSYKREGPAALAKLSTEHLRCALFYEQRRWRHFGEVPNDDAMSYIRAIVGELGRREGIEWLWARVKEGRSA